MGLLKKKNEGASVLRIPLDRIVPNAEQPRKFFEEGALEKLAESIRRYGILQPISVRMAATRSSRGKGVTAPPVLQGCATCRASFTPRTGRGARSFRWWKICFART